MSLTSSARIKDTTPGGASGVSSVDTTYPIIDTGTPTNPNIGIDQTVPVEAYSATTANITSLTYNNGVAGVGATLTKATAFTQANLGTGTDPIVLGAKYLIKNQTTQTQNGIYELTSNTGTFVLTRSSDSDEPTEMFPQGVTITNGTNIGTSWGQKTQNVVFGTSNIVYQGATASTWVQESPTVGHGQYQVPLWNAALRSLNPGTARFSYDGVTLSLRDQLAQQYQNGADFFRVVSLGNLLGTGVSGSAIYAGTSSGISAGTTYAISAAAKHPSLGYLYQAGAVSPLFSSLFTANTSGGFDIASNDLTTNDYSSFSVDTTKLRLQSAKSTGTEGFYFEISNVSDSSVLKQVGKTFAHMSSKLNSGFITNGFAASDTPVVSLQTGGGFAMEVKTVPTTPYLVDSTNTERKDTQLYADTSGTQRRITMPLAASNLGRIIPVTLFNTALEPINTNDYVQVVFPGGDYTQALLGVDFISDAVNETRYYQAILDSALNAVWIEVGNNCPDNNPAFRMYTGDTLDVAPGTRKKIFMLAESVASSTVVNLDTYDIDIPVGAEVSVKDIGGNAGSYGTTVVSAGTIIDRTGFVSSVSMNDFGFVSIKKIASSTWIVTNFY